MKKIEFKTTEIPDGEINVGRTSLMEPLSLSRRKRIVGMKINSSSVVVKT